MPVLTGLLPASFLPKEKRRVPWIILSGYLVSFALFETLGIPVLLFTTYGDYVLLCRLFTAADLAVIALGLVRCIRSGGICMPYAVQVSMEIHHLQLRAKEDGKRYAESAAAKRRPRIGGRAAKGTPGRNSFRERAAEGNRAAREAFDPDAMLFWIIFALLLLFELYMSYTNASIDGDDAYYVAQSVQTWQTGTMYYYVPYTGWTTTLDGRHALSMMPIWVAYIATACGTHPTIVAHSLLPMVLIPLADLCLYCAASELTCGFPQEKQQRMLPAIMILIAMMQIFGNISIYTPETFLILRTWQGKSLFANLILPAALVLLLYRCGVNGKEAGRRRETLFFWICVVSLNMASGFTTALAPAILTVLLLGAAFLIAVFLKKGWFLLKMFLACIPNYMFLMLLLRTINSQWFSFLKGGRLP